MWLKIWSKMAAKADYVIFILNKPANLQNDTSYLFTDQNVLPLVGLHLGWLANTWACRCPCGGRLGTGVDGFQAGYYLVLHKVPCRGNCLKFPLFLSEHCLFLPSYHDRHKMLSIVGCYSAHNLFKVCRQVWKFIFSNMDSMAHGSFPGLFMQVLWVIAYKTQLVGLFTIEQPT